MKEFTNKFKNSVNKRTVTKDEFVSQVVEIVEFCDPYPLSPEAFELAVRWMYKKYKLGLAESH